LLQILGLMDSPTSGQVLVDGEEPHTIDPAAQAAFRNKHVGFIVQDHCRLPQLSVLETSHR
jgi:ABC-type lipoprotein export system ATPase subunit